MKKAKNFILLTTAVAMVYGLFVSIYSLERTIENGAMWPVVGFFGSLSYLALFAYANGWMKREKENER